MSPPHNGHFFPQKWKLKTKFLNFFLEIQSFVLSTDLFFTRLQTKSMVKIFKNKHLNFNGKTC